MKEQVQCATSADCATRGAEFVGTTCEAGVCVEAGPDYSCVGHSPSELMGSDVVMVDARFANVGSDRAPPGLKIRTCGTYDVECTDPLDEVTTDEKGRVTLALPLGFTGYLEVVSDETIPAQLVFVAPVDETTTIDGDGLTVDPRVPLFSEAQLGLLLKSVGPGVTYDSSKTNLLMRFLDCARHPAPGAYLEMPKDQSDAIVTYVEEQLPDLSLTETGADANLAVINMEPGLIRFSIKARNSDQLLMSVTVPSRAGRLIFLNGSPNQ